jgi:uncharacterized protein
LTPDAEANTDPVDDSEQGRITISDAGTAAKLEYRVECGRLLILHTEVPEVFRSRGVGGRLVAAAVTKAAREGLTIVPWCPFARRWLQEGLDRAGSVPVDFERPAPTR